MASGLEQAVWRFEEAVDEVVLFVKGASYGLRLASKRVGDLAVAGPLQGGRPGTAAEMERLTLALERGDNLLSDAAVLALGDHFRQFLAGALELAERPELPGTVADAEALAGIPGALAKVSFWVPLLLQLYRVALRGGRLDRRALQALGRRDLELPYPGGKVKLFQEGDRVTLGEGQLEEMGAALVEAAKAVQRRLLTS